jgi:hypothetical protein
MLRIAPEQPGLHWRFAVTGEALVNPPRCPSDLFLIFRNYS